MEVDKTHSSKAKIIISIILGKISSIIGYTFAIMVAIVIIGTALAKEPMDSDSIIGILICTIIGVLLITKGIQIKNRIKRFKRYVNIISLENEISLEKIAANTSQSIDFVTKDIQKMIEKRYFVNAYIDIATNEIVLQNRGLKSNFNAAESSVSGQMITVTCRNCGASNSIQKGTRAECEFCGSPL